MKKEKFVLLGMLVVLILMTVLITGCGNKEDENTNNGEIPFYTTDAEVFDIETPYCTLQFPVKWEKKVNVTNVEGEDNYLVTFSTLIDDVETPIFDIVFNNSEEGFLVGNFTKDEEVINVYIVNHIPELDGYTQEKRDVIGGMLEDSNVIISKLLEQYEFELA